MSQVNDNPAPQNPPATPPANPPTQGELTGEELLRLFRESGIENPRGVLTAYQSEHQRRQELQQQLQERERAEAERQRQAEQADAQRRAEQGQFKELYEAEQRKAQKAEADLQAERRKLLVAEVADAASLPAELREFLTAETKADLEAQALKLSQSVKAPPAPNTEGGANNDPAPRRQQSAQPRRWTFQRPGDAEW